MAGKSKKNILSSSTVIKKLKELDALKTEIEELKKANTALNEKLDLILRFVNG